MTFYPLVNLGDGFAGRRTRGPGDGVLWLHPYGLDSSCWGPLWDQLPDWRHIAVDLPGHGLSEPLPPRQDARHGTRHLVGLSLGAALGLGLALESPDAFASLSLASPVIAGWEEAEPFWVRYRELANMYWMGGGFGAHLRGRMMLVEPSAFDGARERPALWESLWRIAGRHPFWDLSDAAYLRVAAVPPPPPGSALPPTRLLLGATDPMGSLAVAARLEAALGTPPAVSLAGAAHLSLLEEPAPAAAALHAHFDAHAGGPAAAARPGAGA
jgi:pimeloyl-ACP methyl ester carboxylesterase